MRASQGMLRRCWSAYNSLAESELAKLQPKPIDASDLESFVGNQSAFAFEMRAVSELRRTGFECWHAATYRDPVTDKIRQYDVRAVLSRGNSKLALSVECKNLQENAPLLLSAVPRTQSESFHHLLWSQPQAIRVSVKEMSGDNSLYKPGQMVGKQSDQVGRDNNGVLLSDDQATFDKMNQAVSSCRDLVAEHSHVTSPFVVAIVPVVVLPDNRLWQVDYDAEGLLQTPPRQVPRSTLFLNHTWSFGNDTRGHIHYRLSHIEFITLGTLASWADRCFDSGGLFP